MRRFLRRAAQRGLEDIADFLWPGACRNCGAGLPEDMPPRRCGPRAALAGGRIRRCLPGGLSLPLWLLCARCCESLRPETRPRAHLAGDLECVSAFAASPAFFELVHAFKYGALTELAPWFGNFLAHAARRSWGSDVVLVPVPLHRTRFRSRGFNQSALLAKAVAGRLGAPIAIDLLERCRATSPQARLPHAERALNVAGAFARRTPLPAGAARIVLVDDVVTTGATAAAACAALGCDAARVALLTLCRARPDGSPAGPGSAAQMLRGQGFPV
jgi:ComF family protein